MFSLQPINYTSFVDIKLAIFLENHIDISMWLTQSYNKFYTKLANRG